MERQVGEGLVNSEMNRPRLDHEEGVSRGFGDSAQGVEPMSVDQCDSMREIEDSRIVGAPVTLAGDAEVLAREQVPVQMVLALEAVRGAAARNSEESIRKPVRGRPPRSQRRSTPAQPPPRRRRDEEDVCFICFDGGSLVLCDRRGCPKAYHPACIKRDESFFRSKARWNCGWHICSSCQKASHYMCYTCTFSLCKACTKDADYLCVRGDKGFCGTCMRTVMLIENIPIGNKEAVQVDFDDKGNWEYLFKVYWIYLKQKLSLTVEELTKAKNPWKAAVALPPKVESPGGFYNNNDEKVCRLDNSCRNLEANNSKRRKTRNQPYLLNQGFGGFGKSGGDGGRSLSEGMPWATKELSEFVAYMKNGDSSMLSQFDVQALLLEYIKRNDLRDPGQKCQIICDSRLKNLFGKERVGHFEMLKLLEYHFLIKENVPANHIADPITGNGEAAESNDNQLTINNDRKHKTRKKSDGRGVQSNPNEYAAIDVHNINLLYMKRNLMENLLDDAEKFHDIVSGSIVRIRIPVDQKQDMYRLVQVIGTSKVAESHKVGTRTTDVKLEILNLDKKEVVSIDEISNQEFSEDECKCLRQSIKCGHIQRLIVGEIQKKAIALWAVRVEECLEAEVWKLSHLRDRASEKGHRKELRECVEKLELLNSLEERQRRLNEIPEVHADPSMDPSYESEENDGKPDEKKQDAEDLVRRGKSVVVRKIVEEKSPGRETSVFNNIGSRGLKNLGTAYDQSRNTTFYVDKDGTTLVHEPVHASTWNEGGESFDSNNWTQPKNQVGPASSVTSTWNDQDALQSELHPWVASESSLPPCSTVTELSVHDFETERLWHYQDPAGNIQGPFSMLQLHKWSTSGHFPSDLRVWRINEKQEDSILLSDAFNGQHSKVSVLICNKPVLPVDVSIPSDGAHKIVDAQCENSDATRVDNEKVEVTWSSMQNDTSIHNNSDNESARSNKWSSHSSSWTRHAHPAPCNQKTEGSLIGVDLPKDIESRADQPQSCTSLPSPTPSEELRSTPSLQVMEGCEDEKRNASPGSVTINPPKTTGSQSSIADGSWKLADGESYSGQASGQSWKLADRESYSGQASGQGLEPPPINCSSNGLVSGSGIVSLTMSLERSQQKQENHFPDFPCATPKNNQGGSEGQATENKQSMSLSVHVLDSGPSWCGTSSLLGGELQLPEVPGDGFVGSPTQTRPSVDEWGSNLVSSSSLRPIEVASDYAATPASVSSQPTHSSAAHLADASSWQPFVHEPTEFCSLPGESVSDLLAEVEAMEALDHLSSPTSSISCGGEFRDFTEGTENDCFSPVEGFSPIPEQRRSDALSSSSNLQIPSHGTVPDESSGVAATFNPTGDLQMPHQSTVTNESLGVSPIATLDPQKRSGGHVSLNAEVQGDAKPRAASVNGWEAGADVKHHPVPSSSEVSEGTILGRTSSGGGGQPQENANFELGISQGSGCHNNDANSATSTGNASSCGYQSRHVTERLSGQRDRNSFYNRDSGFGKARNFRNRQAAHGGVNGGGSFRPLPKGHRVCKFYESGHCKKGASCSYRHP